MSDIITFIEKLPVILSYIVYGGVFLNIYSFLSLKPKKEGNIYRLMSYVIISYIFKLFYDTMSTCLFGISDTGSLVYLSVTVGLTILLAFALSAASKSSLARKIFDRLRIKRTPNDYVWNDLIDKNMWVIAKRRDSNEIYFGFANFIEESQRNPIIALKHYAIGDCAKHLLVFDKTEDDCYLVIRSEEMETIEILYNDGNSKVWEYFMSKL